MMDAYDFEEPLELCNPLAGAFWGFVASSPIWIAIIAWLVIR